jgi:isoleucyl-tRNA synthetase
VHLVIIPKYSAKVIDRDLEERMELAQRASSMILALRRKVNIKVRQPLAKILIPVLDNDLKNQFELIKNLVLGEVNVKDVEYIHDTKGLIVKKIKPNFKTLGKKYGKQMKEISAAFAGFGQEEIFAIEDSNIYRFAMASGEIEITAEDYEIVSEDMPGWLVAVDGKLTIALDITVSDELGREGTAREIVNRIQNLRKESRFDVTDKIVVEIEPQQDVVDSLRQFSEYVCNQTLATEIKFNSAIEGGFDIEWDEGTLKIKVTKVL